MRLEVVASSEREHAEHVTQEMNSPASVAEAA